MAGSFDPYHKWLGIPTQDQPPHHYRLLGIEPLESDLDVIASAADGRMAHLKSFQTGKHSDASQRLLNEIAAAKVCLLNEEKKAEYDRQLREQLQAKKSAAPEAAPPKPRKPKSESGAAPQLDVQDIGIWPARQYAGRTGKRMPWQVPLAVAAVALLLVVALVYAVTRNGDPTVARKTPPAGLPQKTVQKETPLDHAIQKRPGPVGPHLSDPSDGPPHAIDSPEGPATGDPFAADDPTTTSPEPDRTLADLIDPEDPDNPPGQGDPPVAPATDPPTDSPVSSGKAPVPDRDARAEAKKRIQTLFARELAEAATPEAKAKLAAKLLNHAKQTSGDPAAKFMLMRTACDLAAEAGRLDDTLDVVDRLQEEYQVDGFAVKAYAMDKLVSSLRNVPQTPAVRKQMATAAAELAEEVLANDDFDTAGGFMRLAMTASRMAGDTATVRSLSERNREIGRLQTRFAVVKKALDVLAETADDADANLKVGQWYCFDKGDWDSGLPRLAKGADAKLAELAGRDAAGPEDPVDQVELAEQWQAFAARESKLTRPKTLARAAYWCQKALPKLTALDKVRAEKLLVDLLTEMQPKGPTERGAVQLGNVALADNGTTVSGVAGGAKTLLDGNSTQFTGVRGFASSPWPCEWVFAFDKVYQLREIRFRMYDASPRYCRYILETSADGKEYTLLVDRSKGQWSGWQQAVFPPRPVKAIKLKGLYNNVNNAFHVVEFEAYCVPPQFPPPPRSQRRGN